ncbi:Os11g0685200 [Oryza sativa Japonica Group]|uniref:Os11g0685200 protein n=2 Tax=Oryza sativa subsp. japonica TaxID=39947 RepID=A0A0P0Y5I0_ORYSJ|nr:hypothetical protein OsJ_30487 [Oryza sativa Japonica Group]BAF28833.1 Os11g0685200 [Oryza sativa Japonica Group]BAT15269.1 Os11g0685200 [Oryza sativa Japonica Group]|eukprot:NP_001068470.1 Os11g0685200 [Oryza sativa Japonica Group]
MRRAAWISPRHGRRPLFSFCARHSDNDGHADHVSELVAALNSSPSPSPFSSFPGRRRPVTTMAARASRRGGGESPDLVGRRPDSERKQPDL